MVGYYKYPLYYKGFYEDNQRIGLFLFLGTSFTGFESKGNPHPPPPVKVNPNPQNGYIVAAEIT